MSWLENNPLGIALASACGVLLLISAALVFSWTRPASSGASDERADAKIAEARNRAMTDLEPVSAYRVVTERPVFDESRRPVVAIEEEGIELDEDDTSVVGDQPRVRPTGIVMTPESNMVMLRPEAGGESILAIEGRPLEGEYVGWMVTDIKPRAITLASLAGDVLKLDLEVNTRKIAEPPKPAPPPEAARPEDKVAGQEGEEPISRAEEIRQRIAERREELRQQAEENQAGKAQPQKRSAYQSAIRNMINRRNENEDDKNGKDDGGNE